MKTNRLFLNGKEHVQARMQDSNVETDVLDGINKMK
jgi:aspartyl/asparaginyl beta-hydroxylase (cupin superfamily)